MNNEVFYGPTEKLKTRLLIGGLVAISIAFAMTPAFAGQARVVGSRPAGCPTMFCGCALSLKLFGKIQPFLNLADNWRRRFPRTHAAPGMVAARSGHVMQLLEPRGGNRWLVWTANSCKRKTCIYERSIAGFTVVNPYASHMAGL